MSDFDGWVAALIERQGWDGTDAVARIALRFIAGSDMKTRWAFTEHLESVARFENLERAKDWTAPEAKQCRYGVLIECEKMAGTVTLVPMEWLPDQGGWGAYGKEFTGLDWTDEITPLDGVVVTDPRVVGGEEVQAEVRRMLWEAYRADECCQSEQKFPHCRECGVHHGDVDCETVAEYMAADAYLMRCALG